MKSLAEIPEKLKNQLKILPEGAGVYQFLDEEGKIIYIGKAKNLKRRVSSYFQKQDLAPKILKLREKAAELKFTETENETEALILEANLIKKHQPKYNSLLRDDKSYVYVRVSVQEDFPKVEVVRQTEADGAKYFGPKTSANLTRETLRLLRKTFPYRTCRMEIVAEAGGGVKIKNPDRRVPCLDKHLSLCQGCCVGGVTREEYCKNTDAIVNFLGGKEEEVMKMLKEKMMQLAEEKRFEKAARVRDQMLSIQKMTERQKVEGADFTSRDIVAFVSEGGKHFFNVFLVRAGKLIDQINLILRGEDSTSEILRAFLTQYYSEQAQLPEEILVGCELEEREVLEEWLSRLRGGRVKIFVPQRGEKNKILRMAENNAQAFAVRTRAQFENDNSLDELAEKLGLEKAPKRMECYDISHSSGVHTTASMVVFEGGRAKPEDYRRFRIKSLAKGEVDDYRSLGEALTRRMSYVVSQVAGLKIMKKGGVEMYVARLEKEEVGRLEIKEENGKWVMREPEIVAGFEGKGIGADLIQAALKKTEVKKLYVHGISEELSDFYERLGFKRAREEGVMLWEKKSGKMDKSFGSVPDLVVLDGGKGQLSAVYKSVNLPEKTKLIALAKREEEVFYLDEEGKFASVVFEENSRAKMLLTRIRDEAHRFANEHRKALVSHDLTKSVLDEVSGIGEEKRKKLLKTFGSVSGIKEAGEEEVAKVVGEKLAAEIFKKI